MLGNLNFQDGVQYGYELIKKSQCFWLSLIDTIFYANLIILEQGEWKQYQVSVIPRWLSYQLTIQDVSHTLWNMLMTA